MPPGQARHEYNSTSVRECQAPAQKSAARRSSPAQPPKGRLDGWATMGGLRAKAVNAPRGDPQSGGRSPLISSVLPRSPQRGRRGREGRRGEPHSARQRPDCPLKGWERQQAGERTRAGSPGGEAAKKAAPAAVPPGLEPPLPRSPEGGQARGDPRPAKGAPHTGGESKGNRSAAQDARSRTETGGDDPAGAGNRGARKRAQGRQL